MGDAKKHARGAAADSDDELCVQAPLSRKRRIVAAPVARKRVAVDFVALARAVHLPGARLRLDLAYAMPRDALIRFFEEAHRGVVGACVFHGGADHRVRVGYGQRVDKVYLAYRLFNTDAHIDGKSLWAPVRGVLRHTCARGPATCINPEHIVVGERTRTARRQHAAERAAESEAEYVRRTADVVRMWNGYYSLLDRLAGEPARGRRVVVVHEDDDDPDAWLVAADPARTRQWRPPVENVD